MQSSRSAILIVEQDEPTRELYARALCRDYHVLACEDDHDVLELLRVQPIRVVVLEPAGSNSRGWTLLAAITQTHDRGPIPVILCSTLDERKRALALGANTYLVKPVLPTTLVDVVRRILDEANV